LNRVINKVLTDFGDASLLGIKAIGDGQIAPMNPNEPSRSQVYLHNNIFFSRAIDAGIETFKIAKGDKAARKSASRDVHCLGALHRMERVGLYTLATVLIDYLGTRFVCQSILPGILSGEKSHTLLYGTVEAGFPLAWDKEMHELLEETLGKMWIANRPLPRQPLTDERVAAIKAAKPTLPMYGDKGEEEKKEENSSATVEISGPIEAKGIKGSDQRNYVLDMTRLTPRDANWVEEEKGGTGMWESVMKNGSSKGQAKIPNSLADDEWTLAVLRPELVNSYTQLHLTKYATEKKNKKEAEKKKEAAKDESGKESDNNKGSEPATDEAKEKDPDSSEKEKEQATLNDEDMEYIKSLRMNVNVFLPDIKSLEGIDDAAYAQQKKDEDMTRDAAKFLWDQVLPTLTMEIRGGTGPQLPHDGRSLTDFLHQNGINCRYLGRLAALAQAEENNDREEMIRFKQGNPQGLARKALPLFWLELLECEMVARASKHVLDRYLTENGGMAAISPMQTVASFLSALFSSGEETAAQTENRMMKRNASEPDEDDFTALTLFDNGGDGDAVATHIRGRTEVWNDIEQEIARRFRYSLTQFNRPGSNGRSLYIPLLRRVCHRTGVRLAAKNYEAGGKCFCRGGRQIAPSYPISPLDVIDIVPLMKHSAAHGGGFTPCSPGSGLPPLHISLPDARATLESAHVHHSGKALSRALDLAQEACSLYQRVAETPAHPGVVRCLDLMASILFDAQEHGLAAGNLAKSLGLLIQVKGFDSPDAINSHLLLFQMLLSGGKVNEAVKHIRAAIFLMELMGGPRHMELANAYHKLGTVYHGANDPKTALRFYKEASSRVSSDRLLEAMISKSLAVGLSHVGDFKGALDEEKKAYNIFSLFLGKEHNLTKGSDQQLSIFTAAAVQQGSNMVKDTYTEKEAAAADAIANELEAEEAAAEKGKKKNKKKKGKK
jgi:protein TIF31